jgi:creatinine amidohydrolase
MFRQLRIIMVQLAEISWEDAAELFDEVDVVIIPVGSTEQHGPHNPLGTDHLVAAETAKKVGENTGVPVLPVIPVGVSEHHRQFHGSLWVSPKVFREYVKEVALSAVPHGARKVVFLNGHGGNTASLNEISEDLRRKHEVFACVVSAFPSMEGHAGEGETSVNLYFHGDLVDMSRAVDTEQEKNLGELEMIDMNKIGPAQFPWDTIDLSNTGVLGSAGTIIRSTKASGEKGRELMDPHIEKISNFIEKLKEARIAGLFSKPHK